MQDPSFNPSPNIQNGQQPSSQSESHNRNPQQNPQENQANQHNESCSSDDQIVCVYCQKQIKRSKIYKHLKKHKSKPRKQPHRGVDNFWGWGTYAQKSRGRPKASMNNGKESGQKSSQNKKAPRKISKRRGCLQLQRLGQMQMSVKGRQVGKYQLKRRKFNNLDYKKYLQPEKSLLKRQQESQSSSQEVESEYEEYKPASQESQIQIQNQSVIQNDNQGSENMNDEQLSVQQIFKKVKKSKKIKKMKVQQQKGIKYQQNYEQEIRSEIAEQKKDHKQRKYKKNNLKTTYPKITSFVRSQELTQRNKQYVSTLEKQVIRLRKENKQSQLQVSNLNKKIKQLTDFIQANQSLQEKNNNQAERYEKKQQNLNNKMDSNLSEEKKMPSDQKIKFEKDMYKIQDSPTNKTNSRIQKKQKQSKSDNSKKNEPSKQNKLKQMKIDVDWFKKDVTKNNQKNITGSNKTNVEVSPNIKSIQKISISDFNMMEEEQSKKQKYQTLD